LVARSWGGWAWLVACGCGCGWVTTVGGCTSPESIRLFDGGFAPTLGRDSAVPGAVPASGAGAAPSARSTGGSVGTLASGGRGFGLAPNALGAPGGAPAPGADASPAVADAGSPDVAGVDLGGPGRDLSGAAMVGAGGYYALGPDTSGSAADVGGLGGAGGDVGGGSAVGGASGAMGPGEPSPAANGGGGGDGGADGGGGVRSGGAGGAGQPNCISVIRAMGYATSSQTCAGCLDNGTPLEVSCRAMLDCMEPSWPCLDGCERDCRNRAMGSSVVQDCVDRMTKDACAQASPPTESSGSPSSSAPDPEPSLAASPRPGAAHRRSWGIRSRGPRKYCMGE
jgi:hypothetical protein